jgi:hypothetical protein
MACGPASKLAPVGVSGSRDNDRERLDQAGAAAPMLAGLPADFRTTWTKTAGLALSEHGRFTAEVYEDKPAGVRFAEDLFIGDAGIGVYLIERTDAGVRFAVGDPRGAVVADSTFDAGASVEACVRCHANARGSIYPVMP